MRNNQPVHPAPQLLSSPPDQQSLTFDTVVAEGDLADHAQEILHQMRPDSASGDVLAIRCLRSSADILERDPITGFHHGEGYRLTVDADGRSALLEFAQPRGLRYGLATVFELLEASAWCPGLTIEDAPRFPVRGFIEGFYGPPWPPDKRHEIMGLMARYKMNSYFYGPKDDTYHRRRWRELYPGEKLNELQTAFSTAVGLDMDFWYTIGPGLSMAYSNEADVVALEQKMLQISDLGVSNFGILFDDIPEDLQHVGDLSAFATLPDAHASVANHVFQTLQSRIPDLRFAVCPTQYSGTGNESYITKLGQLADPRIEILWTGPEICSREITLQHAALLERTILRPALLWDNYPVNDCEMTNELHIGPYRGRDPHLYRASIGVVANGMELPESSKIGLMTIADYLWNPEAYDPETSWDHALRTVVGENQWQAFRIFADNSRFSPLYRTDSPWLSTQLRRVEFLRTQDRPAEALQLLRETIEHLQLACELFDSGLENGDLSKEIGRWVSKYRKGVALLQARLNLETSATEDAKAAFDNLAESYFSDRTYLFADVLNWLVEE